MNTKGIEGFAAIFVDYENVYYHLRNKYADIPELSDFVVELLMNLQNHLEEKFRLRSIIAKAYADYERIKATPQGSLYLMGVETVYVLGTEHKNAADMKLCIDAMEVLYTRPEIETFVLFAGDRDYIPLIQHLKQQAKSVIAVGFEGAFSGDLMTNVGRRNFIDGNGLFSAERLAKLEEFAKRYNDYAKAEQERKEQLERDLREREAKLAEAVTNTAVEDEEQTSESGTVQSQPSTLLAAEGILEAQPAIAISMSDASTEDSVVVAGIPLRYEPLSRPLDAVKQDTYKAMIADLNENERLCLGLLVKNYGMYHEIFLSPFLRKLSDALPNLADWERKDLMSDLESKGALRMEKRSGVQHDYTVVILNYNHPVVREMC
jgi:uncharacterized LabA/DUF88 family protein